MTEAEWMVCTDPVSMLGLATAVPPYALEQAEIARRAETAFADTFARFPQLAEVFKNTGIERRYSARPVRYIPANAASDRR